MGRSGGDGCLSPSLDSLLPSKSNQSETSLRSGDLALTSKESSHELVPSPPIVPKEPNSAWIPITMLKHMRQHAQAELQGAEAMQRVVPTVAGGRDLNKFLPVCPIPTYRKRRPKLNLANRLLRAPKTIPVNGGVGGFSFSEYPGLTLNTTRPSSEARQPVSTQIKELETTIALAHEDVENRLKSMHNIAHVLSQHDERAEVGVDDLCCRRCNDLFNAAEATLFDRAVSLVEVETKLASSCVDPLAACLGLHCAEHGYVLTDTRYKFATWLSSVSNVATGFRLEAEHLEVEAVILDAQVSELRRRNCLTRERSAAKQSTLVQEEACGQDMEYASEHLEAKVADQSRIDSAVLLQAMFRGVYARNHTEHIEAKRHKVIATHDAAQYAAVAHASALAAAAAETKSMPQRRSRNSSALDIVARAILPVVNCTVVVQTDREPDTSSAKDVNKMEQSARVIQTVWRVSCSRHKYHKARKASQFRASIALARSVQGLLSIVRTSLAEFELTLRMRHGPRIFALRVLGDASTIASSRTVRLDCIVATHAVDCSHRLLMAKNTASRFGTIMSCLYFASRRACALRLLRRLILRWHRYWLDNRPVSRKSIDLHAMLADTTKLSDNEDILAAIALNCNEQSMERAVASSREIAYQQQHAKSKYSAIEAAQKNIRKSDSEHCVPYSRTPQEIYPKRDPMSFPQPQREAKNSLPPSKQPVPFYKSESRCETSVRPAVMSNDAPFEKSLSTHEYLVNQLANLTTPLDDPETRAESNEDLRSRTRLSSYLLGFANAEEEAVLKSCCSSLTERRTCEPSDLINSIEQVTAIEIQACSTPITKALQRMLIWRGILDPGLDEYTLKRDTTNHVIALDVKRLEWVRRHVAELTTSIAERLRVSGLMPKVPKGGATLPTLGFFPSRIERLPLELRAAFALGWKMVQRDSALVCSHKPAVNYACGGACCVDAPWLVSTTSLSLRGCSSSTRGDVGLELYATVRHLVSVGKNDPLISALFEVLASHHPSPTLLFFAHVTELICKSHHGKIFVVTSELDRDSADPKSYPSFMRPTVSYAGKSRQSVVQRLGLHEDDEFQFDLTSYAERRSIEKYVVLQAVAASFVDYADRQRFMTLGHAFHILAVLYGVNNNLVKAALRYAVIVEQGSNDAYSSVYDRSRDTVKAQLDLESIAQCASQISKVRAYILDDKTLDDNVNAESFLELSICICELVQKPIFVAADDDLERGHVIPSIDVDVFRDVLIKFHIRQLRRLRCAHVTTVLFEAADHDGDGRLCWSEFLLAYYALEPKIEEASVLVIYEQALYDTQTESLDYGTFDRLVRGSVLTIVTKGSIEEATRFLGRDRTSSINDLWAPDVLGDARTATATV